MQTFFIRDARLKASRVLSLVAAVLLVPLLIVRCGSSSTNGAETPESQVLTPLILSVQDAPVPFTGSDSRTHLVYELWIANFTSSDVIVEEVAISGDGEAIQTLDTVEVASRLQPAGKRTSSGTMAEGTQSLLFLHLILAAGASVPKHLNHRVMARIGGTDFTESGGATTVNPRPVVIGGPPLRGSNYISADSCCDASRHTRAALPVNGRVWVAQRYAVDWEQLDSNNRIYVGPRENVASYKIFGAEALAVANATVAFTVDGLPEQTPGKFPENLPLEQADGNAVILDLGSGNFALYAHLQPDSVSVHVGEKVTTGQVLGLVGNSGNSIAPHLHFQVMSTSLALASNGLPYGIDSFRITGLSPGTAAFDKAEADGTPLEVKPVSPPTHVTNALPLDQLIISFAP
jgi:Peptidase family M23